MSRKATSASGNNLYLRLYLLPIIVFILLLVLLSVLLFNQRRVELEGVDDLLQLQSGLLAEKISSKLNTFELTLRMLELTASTVDLDDPVDQEFVGQTVRQQLFLHEDIEGVCLLSVEGEKLYSSYHSDFEALEQVRQTLIDIHFQQGLPFALTTFSDHGAKHLIMSRSLSDRDAQQKALVALVIETEQFFDLLDIGLSPGLVSAILYDHTGQLFAIWNNPHEAHLMSPLLATVTNVSDLPVYGELYGKTTGDSTLFGGLRLQRKNDALVSFAQTDNFSMTLGILSHTPTAMAAFDRSIIISLSVVFVIMAIALLIDHQLVKKTKMNDQMHQQMVDELSVQVQQRTAQLQQMLGKDSLTGIMNRHLCSEEIEEAIDAHETKGNPFCVIGIDLDGFKEINDTFGHLIGDRVLVHITKTLEEALGNSGIISRWGGDELLVLLPKCSLEDGYLVAERLRQEVENRRFDGKIHCTISLGVAEHHKGESATTLIDRADTAMYDAKTAGKNCVR